MFGSHYSRILLIFSASLILAACNSSSSSSSDTSDVSIRFSDAPVDDLTSVVITVDQLVFNREGEDIIVDTFTSEELGITDSDTFEIDLLQVQGNDNLLVLDSVELPVGEYQDLRIVVLDEDTDFTYVEEIGGTEKKQLKVPSNELKLGAFTVGDASTQTFVIEFGLRQAMTHNPGPDRYILKPRGVRIIRLEDASTISGTVDLSAIHLLDDCSDKADTTLNNVAYLYVGHNLDSSLLGDTFVREDSGEDPEFDPDVGSDMIAPLTSTSINGSTGEYLFPYLNSGNYTLAISCKAGDDDPVIYDEINVPSPSSQLIELRLENDTDLDCSFPNPETCTELE